MGFFDSDKTTTSNNQSATNFNTNTTGLTDTSSNGTTTTNGTSNLTGNTTGNTTTNNIGATSALGQTQSTSFSTLPQQLQDLILKNASTVSNLYNANPSSYIAGPSALQQAGFTAAANASSNPGGDFTNAAELIGKAAQGGASASAAQIDAPVEAKFQSGSNFLGQYLNPYTDSVVNSTLADFDQNAGQQRAALDAKAALNNGFGGSGYAIQAGELGGDLARARATTESGLRSAGFNTALNAGLQDASQANQVGEFNAGQYNARSTAQAGLNEQTNLANAGFANDALTRSLQAGTALSGVGTAATGAQSSTLQDLLTAGSAQQTLNQQQASAPITVAQMLSGLQNPSEYGLLSGQTSTGNTSQTGTSQQTGDTSTSQQTQQQQITSQVVNAILQAIQNSQNTTSGTSNTTGSSKTTESDPMGDIGKILQAGASIAAAIPTGGASLLATPGVTGGTWYSDARLKRDIRTVGHYANGVRKVAFRYLWSEVEHIGAVAQEVLRVRPQAVSQHPSGFLQVDYGMMGV